MADPHSVSFLAREETWLAVALVGLVAIAWKPVKAAVTSMLDDRSAKIAKDLDEAAKLRAEAEALLAEYTAKHDSAMKTADQIVAHAREEAARLAQTAERDLAASLKRREQAALERIAQAERQAMAEVRGAAVDIAIAATQRLVAQNAAGAAGAALIDQSIRELPGRLN